MSSKTTINWLFNGIFVGVFQQTVVSVYGGSKGNIWEKSVNRITFLVLDAQGFRAIT